MIRTSLTADSHKEHYFVFMPEQSQNEKTLALAFVEVLEGCGLKEILLFFNNLFEEKANTAKFKIHHTPPINILLSRQTKRGMCALNHDNGHTFQTHALPDGYYIQKQSLMLLQLLDYESKSPNLQIFFAVLFV